MVTGSELENKEEIDCKWLLREKEYGVIETLPIFPFKIRKWTGKYTGRIYCMYTCNVTKRRAAEKILETNISSCPHLLEINNKCPIIEKARELEIYYSSI